MRKKFLSVLLVSAMSASLLAGCGDKKDSSDNKKATSDIDPTKAPSTDGWDDSKKIYAYSWDDDFSNKLGYVLDKYPEYKDYVEFVTLGVGGTTDEYKTGIDEALKSDKYSKHIFYLVRNPSLINQTLLSFMIKSKISNRKFHCKSDSIHSPHLRRSRISWPSSPKSRPCLWRNHC